MSATTPALLAAAAGVGFSHPILPGLGFAILELTGHGHHHDHDHSDGHHHHFDDHGHDGDRLHLVATSEVDELVATEESRFHGLASVMVPLVLRLRRTSRSFLCSQRPQRLG